MKRRKIFLFIIALYSIGLHAQGIDDFMRERDSIMQSRIGTPYPSFDLKSLANESISSQSLIGKVTLINFWFQGCAPCVADFDELNTIYHQFAPNPNFQFLSFTFDDIESVTQSVKKYELPYTICSIPSKECYRLNLNSGFPTTILIDTNGKIAYYKSGGYIDKEKIKHSLEEVRSKITNLLHQ